MSGNNSKKIAFNHFGGKFSFIEYLYEIFPPKFTHLVDLFAIDGRIIELPRQCHSDSQRNKRRNNQLLRAAREHEDELIRC